MIGGLALIVGATFIGGPNLGALAGGAQGVGSARAEGTEQGYSDKQTAALAFERGITQAILGKIPGSRSVSAFSKIAEMMGLNITQSVMENKLRGEIGLKNVSDWEALKDAAFSPGSWAGALVGAAVHHVIQTLPENERPKAPEQNLPANISKMTFTPKNIKVSPPETSVPTTERLPKGMFQGGGKVDVGEALSSLPRTPSVFLLRVG